MRGVTHARDVPTEPGNRAIKEGSLPKLLETIKAFLSISA
jgi:hypothetical protein